GTRAVRRTRNKTRATEPVRGEWPEVTHGRRRPLVIRNARDRHISGGRICPSGKLPDASRPPVGRTRGAQSHPGPV
ncbi:MAG: hypothetical protein R6U98_22310, partial [Pirellulaceae bacterium]